MRNFDRVSCSKEGSAISELKAVFRGGKGESGNRGPRGASSSEELAAEFPTVEIRWTPDRGEVPSLPLSIRTWESRFFNFYDLDALLDDMAERTAGPFALLLAGDEERLPGFALEVLTRCQRLTGRRNEASRSDLFDRILAEHQALHDLAKPLVRADYNHALDTWQWALRLDPEADLSLQIAALFHDVERLTSETDARIEHHAANYQDFKENHALKGAWMADQTLARAGVDERTRRRTARLITEHERPPAAGDPEAREIALLNDADALSFFSLNSVGYLDYYGLEQTRRKVAYTLRRLRPGSLRYLDSIRLRPKVAEVLAEALEKAVA